MKKELLLVTNFKKYFERTPFFILDIGASGGIPKLWKPLSDYLKVIGFEPNINDNVHNCKDNYVQYLPVALSDKKRLIKFNITKNPQLSSIFHPNQTVLDRFNKSNLWSVEKCIETEADTLDNLYKNKISDIDFIKVDTQGSELSILKGAENVLADSVFAIETEVEYTSIYNKQPLFSNLDIFLRNHKFELMEIMRSKYWKKPVEKKFVKSKGQIVYGDFLYFRDIDTYFEILLKKSDKRYLKSKILKAFVISILYDHMDYGFELIERALINGLFDEKEHATLHKYINNIKEINFLFEAYNKLPSFRGKEKLFMSIYGLLNIFKKKDKKWINGAIWR